MTADNITGRKPGEPIFLIRTGVVPESDRRRQFFINEAGIPIDGNPNIYASPDPIPGVHTIDLQSEISDRKTMAEVINALKK